MQEILSDQTYTLRLGGDTQFNDPFEKSLGASALDMTAEQTPLRGLETVHTKLSLTFMLRDSSEECEVILTGSAQSIIMVSSCSCSNAPSILTSV